ncbi:hypothetical protein [Streptomyces sp. NPDC056468]|uniref:hypothetical protein n=1 Tax=unclassified Streptomyces TaxID=2593676 RepID=UPI00367B00FF
MKIAKLVKIAAGGLAVLTLSASLTLGTGTAPERSIEGKGSIQTANTQSGEPRDGIDWP